MKVNMTPNPLDVVTIHASQGDTEARQWEFELHNNGELIDTSDITEQLFFKAYKGGTEQILPENTSTPTTSPFKGDIRYPQGLLTDQEFTYRQSPTEEDGLAKITDIKGNTLVWNQLVQNGNFADGLTNWSKSTSADTATVSNNVLSFHASVVYGSVSNTLPIDINNHLILAKAQVRITGNDGAVKVKVVNDMGYTNNTFAFSITEKNVWKDVLMYGVYQTTPSTSARNPMIGFADYRSVSSDNLIEVKNVQVFDLTQMGLDITDPSEFTSLFPLPYYAYNQGTLLSFMGNGIKTVGKNLLNPSFTTIDAYINGSGVITVSSNDKSVIVPLLPNLSYVFTWNRGEIISSVADDTQVGLYNEYPSIGVRGVFAGNTSVSGGNIRFNSASNRYAVIKISNITRTDFDSTIIGSQLEFGTSATSYEPYTSSTLSLPISTYFPTGMKLAGTVYDELTPTKAITRVGVYTITSFESKSGATANNLFSTNAIRNLVKKPSADTVLANIKSNYGEAKTMSVLYNNNTVGVAINTNGTIYVGFGLNGSVTTLAQANAYVQSNPITVYYELATPTETSFTTASLVTENAEIPLSNEDGVLIGKCTEQLSSESGFIDAKIKLADEDGECYSNKIQLHVERSPQ